MNQLLASHWNSCHETALLEGREGQGTSFYSGCSPTPGVAVQHSVSEQLRPVPCQVRLHRRQARAEGVAQVEPGDGRGAGAVHQPPVPPPGHHPRTPAPPRGVPGPS